MVFERCDLGPYRYSGRVDALSWNLEDGWAERGRRAQQGSSGPGAHTNLVGLLVLGYECGSGERALVPIQWALPDAVT